MGIIDYLTPLKIKVKGFARNRIMGVLKGLVNSAKAMAAYIKIHCMVYMKLLETGL
ncbi:MAG: hypothetical protein K9H14_04565 [Actinomycetia bacterium]|nr:hypothetical protein [Actinomycetes bacterium]